MGSYRLLLLAASSGGPNHGKEVKEDVSGLGAGDDVEDDHIQVPCFKEATRFAEDLNLNSNNIDKSQLGEESNFRNAQVTTRVAVVKESGGGLGFQKGIKGAKASVDVGKVGSQAHACPVGPLVTVGKKRKIGEEGEQEIADFNEILSHDEKCGGRRRPEWQIEDFKRVVDVCECEELMSTGPLFTWSNRNSLGRLMFLKLDRVIANRQWRSLFSSAIVSVLTSSISDHNPLLLDTEYPDDMLRSSRRFRYENFWSSKLKSSQLIQNWWSNGLPWNANIRNAQDSLQRWSAAEFGNLKREMSKKQRELTKLLDGPDPRGNHLAIKRVEKELNELLDCEMKLWQQRSKIQWGFEGDRNTSFFHASATQRKRNNWIKGLMQPGDVWVSESSQVRSLLVEAYKKIYSTSFPSLESISVIFVNEDKWVFGPDGRQVSMLGTNAQNLKVSDLLHYSPRAWKVDVVEQLFAPEDARSVLAVPLAQGRRRFSIQCQSSVSLTPHTLSLLNINIHRKIRRHRHTMDNNNRLKLPNNNRLKLPPQRRSHDLNGGFNNNDTNHHHLPPPQQQPPPYYHCHSSSSASFKGC
ncbi:hypothetical protein ACFE04_025866 [Oxalis oulophora]